MMSYFATHLSFTLLAKEFLTLVNIWQSYRQNGWLCHTPIRLALLSSKMQISPDKVNNLCITDKNCYAMLIGRLVWVNCQEISNFCRPVLTYWLTDWRHQWLTDCWSRTAFGRDSFSLFSGSSVQWAWDFLYGRCKQLFVSELNNAYFSRHLF